MMASFSEIYDGSFVYHFSFQSIGFHSSFGVLLLENTAQQDVIVLQKHSI